MRKSKISRKTAETDIRLSLNLDGSGKSEVATGCGFLDHMLTLFARHGRFDLSVSCVGDTQVDDHHSVEDVGICLGNALSEALGDKLGILRYGSFLLPMDEALVATAVDISGRSHLNYGLTLHTKKIGTFDTELVEDFFLALVRQAQLTLHIKQWEGKNAHHIIEAAFKSFARSLKQAVSVEKGYENEIPSTKGVLG